MKELKRKAAHVRLPGEYFIHPEILRAYIRAQVFPFGIFRINGRFIGIRPNVTKAARHTHSIRPHQLLVVVVGRIGVEAFGIPFLGRAFIKVWIGKKPKSYDAGRVPVVGTRRDVLASSANLDAGIFGFVFKWIRWARRISRIQPKAVTVGIWRRRLLEAWFVD